MHVSEELASSQGGRTIALFVFDDVNTVTLAGSTLGLARRVEALRTEVTRWVTFGTHCPSTNVYSLGQRGLLFISTERRSTSETVPFGWTASLGAWAIGKAEVSERVVTSVAMTSFLDGKSIFSVLDRDGVLLQDELL
jgi:hypothetical protein